MSLLDLQVFACLVALFWLARKFYRLLMKSLRTAGRRWLVAPLVIALSPGMLLGLAMLGEDRPFSDFTDLGVMPWSVVFGDGMVLPAALTVAAASAPLWYDKPLADSVRWRWTAIVIGLTFGFGFHTWDAGNYRKGGFGAYADALTKGWHDFAIYSILVAVIVWVARLVFTYGKRWHKLAFTGLLLVQLVLMGFDTVRGLDPAKMHGACDMVCATPNFAAHLHDALYWLLSLV